MITALENLSADEMYFLFTIKITGHHLQ